MNKQEVAEALEFAEKTFADQGFIATYLKPSGEFLARPINKQMWAEVQITHKPTLTGHRIDLDVYLRKISNTCVEQRVRSPRTLRGFYKAMGELVALIKGWQAEFAEPEPQAESELPPNVISMEQFRSRNMG